jgi:hypothetical protein
VKAITRPDGTAHFSAHVTFAFDTGIFTEGSRPRFLSRLSLSYLLVSSDCTSQHCLVPKTWSNTVPEHSVPHLVFDAVLVRLLGAPSNAGAGSILCS